MDNRPIGIFDSGIGGTSIWKEIATRSPFESTIYLADSKNAPYGDKSPKRIRDFSKKNTEKLLDLGAKLIVVACNTATTNAITDLRKEYDIPFVGIEPAIKPAALQTKTGIIGILATKGTLSSELFATTSQLHLGTNSIIETVGTGLVELIEAGKIYSSEMRDLLLSYVQPMVEESIDYLVLGCSHYPYLIPVLKDILPPQVQIIDSGMAVAKQTAQLLQQHDLENSIQENSQHNFYTNADPKVLSTILNNITQQHQIQFMKF